MSMKVSATSSRDEEPWARIAFWLHVLIGLLLLWHYPVVWLFGFGDHIGRAGDPLLYCLGLFWGLVSAGLAMRWRWTIMAGLMMLFLTMFAPIGGLVVGSCAHGAAVSRSHGHECRPGCVVYDSPQRKRSPCFCWPVFIPYGDS